MILSEFLKSTFRIIFVFVRSIVKFVESLTTTTMGKIGITEILLILFIIVLLFGGRKIPELMKGVGQGMKEFKKASKYNPEEDKNNF
jgi:sec-independent protein translocase protein TatA